ncbi:hypothetical protein HMPREF9094_1541, partial [Fusobacterium animalis ATCC 51191]
FLNHPQLVEDLKKNEYDNILIFLGGTIDILWINVKIIWKKQYFIKCVRTLVALAVRPVLVRV